MADEFWVVRGVWPGLDLGRVVGWNLGMKAAFLFVLLFTASVVSAQQESAAARQAKYQLGVLPGDIRYALPEPPQFARGMRQRDMQEEAQREANGYKELMRLLGPCQLAQGELVRFSYPWALSAKAKDDPSKEVNAQYMKTAIFRFRGGDGYKQAELELATHDLIILTKPTSGSAPVSPLVSLVVPRTMVGIRKEIAQNRLCQPTKTESLSDGGERWTYQHSMTETRHVVQQAQSRTSGFVGNDPVDLTNSQSMSFTVTRGVVLWNFALTFDAKGVVQKVEQGAVGAGEWKRALVP
jgi:hypothetical protein